MVPNYSASLFFFDKKILSSCEQSITHSQFKLEFKIIYLTFQISTTYDLIEETCFYFKKDNITSFKKYIHIDYIMDLSF